MGQIIHFEERAVASLRDRLGAAEDARADLAAFARGHSGAVATIHEAVLAALEAESFDSLLGVVTRGWAELLGLDAVALALVINGKGFMISADGVRHVDPMLIERAAKGIDVALRAVERGNPLFGTIAGSLRAEVLIGIDNAAPLPRGLLLLGQASAPPIASDEGAQLLEFLGAALGAMLRRWTLTD